MTDQTLDDLSRQVMLDAACQECGSLMEEALVNFLTNLQNGEFDQAKTYLNEKNPVLLLEGGT